ncbi:MAG: hypothetical protein Ct9H300mP30_1110 [Methanobacteriota archaeon]|nr:MAG: hypothetical protein Ct9H300mP30_1110 [Euryarchaeota archaeon]
MTRGGWCMRLMRATVFAAVAVIPSILLALAAYLMLGGPSQSTEWEAWMYGPCYGVPGLCIAAAFALGLREDTEE